MFTHKLKNNKISTLFCRHRFSKTLHSESLAFQEGVALGFAAEEVLQHVRGVDGPARLKDEAPVVLANRRIHHALFLESVDGVVEKYKYLTSFFHRVWQGIIW